MEYVHRALTYLNTQWAKIDLKDIALLLAAVWTFYNLLQTGGLHPLLDLKVYGRNIEADGHGYLLCSVEVKNVHLPMVLIEYSAARISWATVTSDADVEPKWQRLGTFAVFEGEEKVWSGGTIRDKLILVTPSDQHLFKLESRIGRKYRWQSRCCPNWTSSLWTNLHTSQQALPPEINHCARLSSKPNAPVDGWAILSGPIRDRSGASARLSTTLSPLPTQISAPIDRSRRVAGGTEGGAGAQNICYFCDPFLISSSLRYSPRSIAQSASAWLRKSRDRRPMVLIHK